MIYNNIITRRTTTMYRIKKIERIDNIDTIVLDITTWCIDISINFCHSYPVILFNRISILIFIGLLKIIETIIMIKFVIEAYSRCITMIYYMINNTSLYKIIAQLAKPLCD